MHGTNTQGWVDLVPRRDNMCIREHRRGLRPSSGGGRQPNVSEEIQGMYEIEGKWTVFWIHWIQCQSNALDMWISPRWNFAIGERSFEFGEQFMEGFFHLLP